MQQFTGRRTYQQMVVTIEHDGNSGLSAARGDALDDAGGAGTLGLRCMPLQIGNVLDEAARRFRVAHLERRSV